MKPFFKLVLLISCFIFIAFSCSKAKNNTPADNTAPVITLKGDADMTVSLGSNTADPGVTAVDNIDGDISSSVSSDWNTAVNQTKTGAYAVNYKVSDKAGNQSNATRKVTVKSTASNLTGEYKTTITFSSGSGAAPNSTVTVGGGSSQITIYPVYYAYHVTADLKGSLNEQLSFDCDDQNVHFNGTGIITNGGKNITLTGTLTASGISQPFSENLIKN